MIEVFKVEVPLACIITGHRPALEFNYLSVKFPIMFKF